MCGSSVIVGGKKEKDGRVLLIHFVFYHCIILVVTFDMYWWDNWHKGPVAR